MSREIREARISSEFYLGLSLLLAVVSHADQVGREKILSFIDPHSGFSHKSPKESF